DVVKKARSVGNSELDLRDGEPDGTNLGHAGFGVITLNHIRSNLGAANTLFGKSDGRGFDMAAAGVDVRGVAETQLDVDGGEHANEFRDLKVANEAAEVIRCLNVQVQRYRGSLTNRGEQRKRQVGGHIKRVSPKILQNTYRYRIRGAELNRDLDHQ